MSDTEKLLALAEKELAYRGLLLEHAMKIIDVLQSPEFRDLQFASDQARRENAEAMLQAFTKGTGDV